jgi:uncharacterized DUF497 family protein
LKYFTWSNAKNEKLKAERGISFEDVVFHIEKGDLIAVLEHPNQERCGGQRVLVVPVEEYIYLIPSVDKGETTVLKTIIPGRKATRKYLQKDTDDEA